MQSRGGTPGVRDWPELGTGKGGGGGEKGGSPKMRFCTYERRRGVRGQVPRFRIAGQEGFWAELPSKTNRDTV